MAKANTKAANSNGIVRFFTGISGYFRNVWIELKRVVWIGGALMGLAYGYGLKNGKDIGAWINSIIDFFVTLFRPGKKMKVTYKKAGATVDAQQAKTDYDYNKAKAERQKAVDHILDKISKGGYDSLTREEKEILFSESQKKG